MRTRRVRCDLQLLLAPRFRANTDAAPPQQAAATPKETASHASLFGGGGMRVEMEWTVSFGVLPCGQGAAPAQSPHIPGM